MGTIKERILEFIAHERMSQRRFEISIGVSNGYLRSLKATPSSVIMESITLNYPQINTTWLLTGDGEMLNKTTQHSETVPVEMPGTSVIRYWNDCDVTAGGVESFDDWKKDFIPICLPDFGDCTDAVNVRGDSMHPVYKNGNIVILKEWKENFIEYGSAYLIVTKNGNRMIKYIKPGADKEHISCVSENEFYEPFEVERADVLRLYKVKGCVAKTEL